MFRCKKGGEQQATQDKSPQQTALERQLAGEMVSISAGKFRMGSRKGEADDAEKPVHRVTVPAFKLGKYEVTVSQFSGFVQATGYLTDAEQNTGGDAGCFSEQSGGNRGWVSGYSWRNPGYPVQDEQPVVCMSWNDVQAFIDWLNRKTGGNYRLPAEAEWEYAARAGSKTEYHFGNNESQLCRYANHAGGSAWTSGDCSWRVVRGGSWNNNARNLRSANRNRNDRSNRNNNNGFRLAQSARCPERPFSRKRPARQTGVHEPASRPGREVRANSAGRKESWGE